jgi:VanZ family protein
MSAFIHFISFLAILSIGLQPYLPHHPLWIPLAVFWVTGDVMTSYPCLTQMLYKKPLDLEEVSRDRTLCENTREKVRRWMFRALNFSTALTLGILTFYYVDELRQTSLHVVEILGVIGGFTSLVMDMKNKINTALLVLVDMYIIHSPRIAPMPVMELEDNPMPIMELGELGDTPIELHEIGLE